MVKLSASVKNVFWKFKQLLKFGVKVTKKH